MSVTRDLLGRMWLDLIHSEVNAIDGWISCVAYQCLLEYRYNFKASQKDVTASIKAMADSINSKRDDNLAELSSNSSSDEDTDEPVRLSERAKARASARAAKATFEIDIIKRRHKSRKQQTYVFVAHQYHPQIPLKEDANGRLMRKLHIADDGTIRVGKEHYDWSKICLLSNNIVAHPDRFIKAFNDRVAARPTLLNNLDVELGNVSGKNSIPKNALEAPSYWVSSSAKKLLHSLNHNRTNLWLNAWKEGLNVFKPRLTS